MGEEREAAANWQRVGAIRGWWLRARARSSPLPWHAHDGAAAALFLRPGHTALCAFHALCWQLCVWVVWVVWGCVCALVGVGGERREG